MADDKAGASTDAVASDDEATDDGPRRCDYCRLGLVSAGVELVHDGDTYRFCSERCRDAVEESEQVFTEYHGFRRTPTGVAPIDDSLPQGIPRNSFVMLTDLAGTRTEAIRAELVWRALERGEPAVVVSFLEPPVSVVQEFVTLDWNVLPYLESGQLGFVDAFTYRMDDRERMYERLNDWNSHLSGFCEGATTRVRDPSDVSELGSRIDDALERRDMQDRGVVVLDSLTSSARCSSRSGPTSSSKTSVPGSARAGSSPSTPAPPSPTTVRAFPTTSTTWSTVSSRCDSTTTSSRGRC